ncbi:MAG: hypothetical protein ACFWUA_03685 [Sporanaerobacter sp.]|uniref:hypothetical protein n=1 Tax=Sporanaerobacter sp. TaxID=2010183 RepID=UPI003A101AF3
MDEALVNAEVYKYETTVTIEKSVQADNDVTATVAAVKSGQTKDTNITAKVVAKEGVTYNI